MNATATLPTLTDLAEPTARELRARELIEALATVEHWRQRIKAYHTTPTSCRCMDHQVRVARGEITHCKHQEAMRLLAERGLALEEMAA